MTQYIFDNTATTTFKCDYCNEAITILPPWNPGTYAALLRAFEDFHAECRLDVKEKGRIDSIPAPGSPAGLFFMQRQAVMAELEETRKENTKLRGLLANAEIPCIYCKLPKENINLCPRGFPGCGRMDDLIEGDHV